MTHLAGDYLSQKLVRDYVCSTCWGHLLRFPEGEMYRVECHNHKEETPGFVTKKYAERRRGESRVDVLEVKDMMRNVGALPANNKTASELLAEMGF